MGHPITQEDLDLISAINFNNCFKFYKKFFFFIFSGYLLYNLIT